MNSHCPDSDAFRRAGILPAIDGLRGLAVFAVLISHAGKHNIGDSISSITMRWSQIGGHGVELFFVLSGFCLGLPFLRRSQQSGDPGFNQLKFFAGRLARILPPYYISVALFAFLSLLPIWHATASSEHGMTARVTLTGLLGHTIFAARDWELLNGSFWTLRIEAIWYLLFPMFLSLFLRSRKTFAIVGCLLALTAVVHVFRAPFETLYKMTLALPAFMLGIVAADMQTRSFSPRRSLWIGFAFTTVLAVTTDFASAPWTRLIWALCAFTLVALANCDPLIRRIFCNPLAIVTGIASYSIYLIHEPIIAMLEFQHVAPVVALAGGLTAGFAFWWSAERLLLQNSVRRYLVNNIYTFLQLLVRKTRGRAYDIVPAEQPS